MSISQNFPILAPTLTHDFVKTKRMDPRITFTRSSSATYFNSSGVLTTAANNEPRFDYNPSTLAARGLLIEEQRTNSIRNNTMQGASNPSTPPTNWGGGSIGLTRTIVGTGTQNGITYIDVRYNGTTNAQFGTLTFEPNNGVAASASQSWAGSAYVSLIAGTLTNISQVGIGLYYFNSTPAFVSSTVASAAITSTLTRYFVAGTTPATTAFVQPAFYFNGANASGDAVDFTVRIGLPQLEQGAFATSVIPTTTTALTRNADVASMTGTNFSSWFNPTQGTIFNISRQAQNRTTGYPTVVCISDSGNGINAIEQYWDNSINFFGSLVYTSSTLQTIIGRSGLTRTDVHENAFAYEANNFACSVDGSAVSTDNSGSIPTIDRLCIGSRFNGSLNFNGYIQRISYYPVRLTNAQLQALTL